VMMSGHGTVETAVEATRLGAFDFIEKPLSLAKLLLTVERALASGRDSQKQPEDRRAREVPEPIGRSGVMRDLRDQIRRIAEHDGPVLIGGEPGAGKHYLSKYLHAISPRAAQPLVELSVSALDTRQVAVELFGSEDRGRVTEGALERAGSGFLL